MTQMEVLFAGPSAYQAAGAATAGWVQAAAAVTTEQHLMVGATGASGAAGFTQPLIPAGYFQQGRRNQLIKIVASGIVSWTATATTMTWKFGVQSAVQGTSTTMTGNTALITSQVFTNQTTSQTNVPWRFDIELLATQVGYGTSAVATAIQACGIGGFSPAVVPAVGSVAPYGPMPPNVTTTIDSTVNNFLYGSITFGSNGSASNTCTMLQMDVFGCN